MKTSKKKYLGMFAIALIAMFSFTSCDEDENDDMMMPTTSGLSTLVTAITTAELTTVLQGDGPFTVFAPTDAAFESLYSLAGVADFDALVNAVGIATIEAVLKYHVVSGRIFSTDLPNLSSSTVTTLGGSFTLNLSSLTIIDADTALELGTEDAGIMDTDILGTNGVIHVIDEVLLP